MSPEDERSLIRKRVPTIDESDRDTLPPLNRQADLVEGVCHYRQ